MKFVAEDIHTEYKTASQNRLPKSIWETVSAFANTDGGNIILGIKENPKEQQIEVTGVSNPEKLKADFLNIQKDNNKISEFLVNDKNFKIEIIDGKTILKIFIPKISFKKRPVYLNNNIKEAYIRENESDRKITEEELKFFIRESDTDIDSDLLDNYTLKDLNLVDIQNYQAALFDLTKNDEYLTNDYLSFLNKIGLIQKDRSVPNGEYKFKKALLLLFGKYNSIIEVFPNFFIDLIIKHNSSDVDYVDRLFTSDDDNHPDNIYSFLVSATFKLENTLKNKFKLDGMIRKDDAEIMTSSVREALINSLVHADYSAKNQIKISAYNDYVVFSNPGDMRVSFERYVLGGESIPRNPNIFNSFIRAKLGEHTGSGGHRIFENSEKLSLRTPDVTSDINKTELIIWTIPLEQSVIDNLPEEWQSTYKFLSKNLIATYSELKHLYKTSYYGHKILTDMVEAGIIDKRGEKKGTKYSIPLDSPAGRMSTNKFIRNFQKDFIN